MRFLKKECKKEFHKYDNKSENSKNLEIAVEVVNCKYLPRSVYKWLTDKDVENCHVYKIHSESKYG